MLGSISSSLDVIDCAPTVAENVLLSAVVIVKVFPAVPEPTTKLCTPPFGTSSACVICPFSLNVIIGTLDAVPTLLADKLLPVAVNVSEPDEPVALTSGTVVSFAEAIAPVAIES